MSVLIIPAVLPKSFAELEQSLERIRGIAREVQVDLVGTNVLAGHEAMPLWEDFDFEVDIMLPNPAAELDAVLALGPTRVVVHAQNQFAHEALQALQSLRDGNFPTAAVLAVPVTVGPEVLEEFAGLYDAVQVMGIAQEGKQGQPYDPRAAELVARIRAMHPALSIQVDGGVNKDTVQALAKAGADRLVAGSAILRAENPAAAYKELYNLANGS